MSRIDDEIRDQFAALRAEDATRAPEFREVWSSAQYRAPTVSLQRTRNAWMLSAAAIAVMAVGLVVWQVERGRAAGQVASGNAGAAPSITTWTAPTDALLHMSNAATSSSPSLLGSALGGVVRAPGSN